MATGMEMLVNAAIKAVGIDPKVMIPQAEKFVHELITKVKEFDERLSALEVQNARLIEQNAQFIAHIKTLSHSESENENG